MQSCMITMLNMAKSYLPEILTQVCYMSIIQMLLNQSYCLILLDYAIIVFKWLIFLYMASNSVLLQSKLWLITYCSKKTCLTVWSIMKFERRFNIYYLWSPPYLCNFMSWYTCAFFTYIRKQAPRMALGDIRGARNLWQLYWNWTIQDTQIESSQDITEYYRLLKFWSPVQRIPFLNQD